MKMVAASRLRRAQEAISSARPFTDKLEELTERIIGELEQSAGNLSGEKLEAFLKNLHPLLSDGVQAVDLQQLGNPIKKIALLVVTSDRGLCGAYNSNAIKNAWKEYSALRARPGTEVVPFFVGRKGQEFFTKRGATGHWFQDFWQGKVTAAKTDRIAQEFTEKFLQGEFQEIRACFMSFVTVITQNPTTKVVLPLKLKEDANGEVEIAHDPENSSIIPSFIYEPGKVEILAELLPALVKTQFYRIFADAMASEFGAKMTAMDNASRNAGELINKLTLESNRVRQAGITKELMEIVGGAEALKG